MDPASPLNALVRALHDDGWWVAAVEYRYADRAPWPATADAFGGWNLVVALQAGGGLTAQRAMMNRTYDMGSAKALAERMAGIAPAA